jgi:hypothetical protein
MKPNYTHLTLVVDRSGSMNSIRTDAQGGINSLIADQKTVAGQCTVSLCEFNDSYNRVFGPVHIQHAPEYVLVPSGSTALLDAVHRAIIETGSFLRDLPEDERPSQVKLIVVTDGHENSSREATAEMVRNSIKHQEDVYNWEFIYIGAAASTFADASRFGFNNSTRYVPTAKGVGTMYGQITNSLRNARLNNVAVASTLASEYDENGAVVSSTS